MKIPVLETDRVRLREFRESDHEAYARFCGDEEVMRYIGTGATASPVDAWRQMAFFIGHWKLRGYGMWALENRATGELLGRVGFHDPHGWPDFELGWLLGREHWGRGYATEGAREALRFAHDVLGRETVSSFIRPDNQRSIKVAQSLGAELRGEVELLGAKALRYESKAR